MTVLLQVDKDKPFLLLSKTTHAVSKNSANWICDVLNANKFELKDNTIWKVMDIDYYNYGQCWDYAHLQAFKKYKNSIKRVEGDYYAFEKRWH